MRRSDKKRVDLDIRPEGPWYQNYDYTEAEPNATSPGGGLYHGSMGKYKSVKEFIDKCRKQNRKKRKKQAILNRMNLLMKLAVKLRVLVLDDDPIRHKGSERAEVTHVYTYYDAVKALETNPAFDIVYFDHDLGDFGDSPTGYGQRELTGSDVALYIARVLPEEKRPKYAKIHSWNPAGAVNIATILSNAGIPFEREAYGEPKESSAQVIWVKKPFTNHWSVHGEFGRDDLAKELERLKNGPDKYMVLPFGKRPGDK